MKNLFIVPAMLVITIQAFAQPDFRQGFIVTNSNDTIHGLIDYKNSRSNSKKCVFKEGVNAERQEFSPSELKAYRFIDSKYYVSKPVNTGENEESLFLEYLINGTVDIYYYVDRNGDRYLIDTGDGILHELKNETREVLLNNKAYSKMSKEYVGILKYLLRQSPSTVKKVDNLGLDHKSLIKIGQDFHNEMCPDEECIVYEKKLPKFKPILGPIFVLNAHSISVGSNFHKELFFLENSRFQSTFFPTVGLFLKMNIPFVHERIFFYYEGTYSKEELHTNNIFIERLHGMHIHSDIRLAQKVFNNSFLIKYEYPKGKFRPTFRAGVFFNYYYRRNFSGNIDIRFPSGEPNSTGKIIENPFESADYGINLGPGIAFDIYKGREMFVDLSYQRGFGIGDKMNSNCLKFNVGLQIW
jgi:hypothetical protein